MPAEMMCFWYRITKYRGSYPLRFIINRENIYFGENTKQKYNRIAFYLKNNKKKLFASNISYNMGLLEKCFDWFFFCVLHLTFSFVCFWCIWRKQFYARNLTTYVCICRNSFCLIIEINLKNICEIIALV